jgi:hypothetical protein
MIVARARQSRAEPAGFAGSVASREGLETLSGFPSQSSSPPCFHASTPVCFGMVVGGPIIVNNAG